MGARQRPHEHRRERVGPAQAVRVGTYHHMSVKHLPAYLDEVEWRFNRENPYLFRDTLLILLHGDALPYQVLIERDDPGERQRENDALIRREA